MADRGINQVTLMGRLCEDAEQKETAKGVPFVYFRLAVRSLRPSRNGAVLEESVMDLQMFNPGNKAQYMTKGRQLIVMGRLETYRKEGDKWDRLKVVVDDSIFTDNKPVETPANGEEPMDYEAYISELQERNKRLQDDFDRLTAENTKLRAAEDRRMDRQEAYLEEQGKEMMRSSKLDTSPAKYQAARKAWIAKHGEDPELGPDEEPAPAPKKAAAAKKAPAKPQKRAETKRTVPGKGKRS